MTALQELYGDSFQQNLVEYNQQYVAGLIISNLSALNVTEVKHDFRTLFGKHQELPDKWVEYIKNKSETMNPNLIVQVIKDRRELPRIIPEEQITYLKIFDMHRKQVYIVFITPYMMDSL